MEVCVKKLLMLFAVMTACAACGKDDGGITMEAVRLEGTYWKQTRMECSEYRDGRWKKTLGYGFDGSLDGGGVPRVRSFAWGASWAPAPPGTAPAAQRPAGPMPCSGISDGMGVFPFRWNK